jgi:hypothetical protein
MTPEQRRRLPCCPAVTSSPSALPQSAALTGALCAATEAPAQVLSIAFAALYITEEIAVLRFPPTA